MAGVVRDDGRRRAADGALRRAAPIVQISLLAAAIVQVARLAARAVLSWRRHVARRLVVAIAARRVA
eukprot:5101752-Prymnesium_polylepis.2